MPPAVLHCRVIFRPAFPARPVTGKELPYLPAFLSQPTVAEKPYTAKMSCIAIICGGKSAPVPPAVLHCLRHLPSRLSREVCHGKVSSAPHRLPLETYGFQTAQRDFMPCIAIGGGKAAPCRLMYCTAASSSVPPFPRGLSREGKLCASSPSSRNIRFPDCAARHDALYRNRLRLHGAVPVPPAVSRFPAKSTQKKRSPVRGFSHVCVWRDSNPRPSESESDALSSCATNTKYPTTIPCFAPESKAIFYSRLFRLCSAGFS